MVDEAYYHELQRRMTDPDTELGPPLSVKTGAEAAASGRAFLVKEFGSEEALERMLRRGRPRGGEAPRGESPVVRGRISASDFAAFKQLEQRTGRKQSELVREAVHLLLAEYDKSA